jgi:hypothetical protein
VKEFKSRRNSEGRLSGKRLAVETRLLDWEATSLLAGEFGAVGLVCNVGGGPDDITIIFFRAGWQP